jgi:hypothetical protein
MPNSDQIGTLELCCDSRYLDGQRRRLRTCLFANLNPDSHGKQGLFASVFLLQGAAPSSRSPTDLFSITSVRSLFRSFCGQVRALCQCRHHDTCGPSAIKPRSISSYLHTFNTKLGLENAICSALLQLEAGGLCILIASHANAFRATIATYRQSRFF